jgi:hypothetical protein
MTKPEEGVEETPLPPKGDGSNGKPLPPMKLRRTLVWSNSLLSLSNSSSKGRLRSSRKSLWSPKAVKWLLPLHQMKRPTLHLKKKSRTRTGKRETSNLTTQLSLIMIIYLTLAPSLQYPLVTPPPHFDGMDYTKWSYSMRMHLISLSLSV